MFFDVVVMSLRTYHVLLRSTTSRVWTNVCFVNKRLFSTTMASSVQTKTSDKEENLLSKRFVGLEKNIW
jgi:hypothetical protein